MDVSGSCSLCAFGGTVVRDVAFPVLPGLEFVKDCGVAEDLTKAVAGDSKDCSRIQLFGTLCGCEAPADRCQICDEGLVLSETTRTNTSSFQLPGIPDFFPTCDVVNAYISVHEANSTLCQSDAQKAKESCPCTSTLDEDAKLPDGDDVLTGENSADPQAEDTMSLTCPLCDNGARPEFWDKDLSAVFVHNDVFGPFLPPNSTLTCGALFSLFPSFSRPEHDCFGTAEQTEGRRLIGGLCGCPVQFKRCSSCQEGLNDPDRLWNGFQFEEENYLFDFRLSCREYVDSVGGLPLDAPNCPAARQATFLCGCETSYMGASTVSQKAALTWIPRVTGLASVVGSALIIRDVIQRKKLGQSTFHQIIFAISLFDVIHSATWIFSSAPSPKTVLGQNTWVYEAVGNEATCRAQGFFVQLGLTAVFYNISLSAYYLLVVIYGTRETVLQKWKYTFHVPPILFGLGLALRAIPFYSTTGLLCHLELNPRIQADKERQYVYWIGPISFSTLVSVISLLLIYFHVRLQENRVSRWRINRFNNSSSRRTTSHERMAYSDRDLDQSGSIPRGSSNLMQPVERAPGHPDRPTINRKLSVAVGWQAIWFMIAFCCCWSISIAAVDRAQAEWDTKGYGLYLAIACLNPLQGFFNMLIYFRPRFVEQKRKEKYAQAQLQRRQNQDSRSMQGSTSMKAISPASDDA